MCESTPTWQYCTAAQVDLFLYGLGEVLWQVIQRADPGDDAITVDEQRAVFNGARFRDRA